MHTAFTSSQPHLLRTAQVSDLLVASGFEVGPPCRRQTTVLDTFDGRLHDAGLRLELRRGGTDELVLTDLHDALGSPAHLTWSGDAPRLREHFPPGPFGARIGARIVERALLAMFDIGSTRQELRRRDRRGKTVAAVTIDEDLTSTSASGATWPDWVAVVVGVTGHEAEEQRTVDRLETAGLDRHDVDLVGLGLTVTGCSVAGRSSSPLVPLGAGDDSLIAFRAVLRNLVATIVENLPGTLADLDPEFLHEFRVAIRRTRSVLAQGRRVLPVDVDEHFRAAFADLGAATGRARDLDVYVLGWADMIAPLHLADPAMAAPVLRALETRRSAAHAAMVEVLASESTGAILTSWQAWLDDAEVTSARPKPIGPMIATRIAKAQATLLADGRAIGPDSPGERLHDLRKDAKKLRYLLECFGGLFPTKARKAFVSQLKALQENLGDHQDAEVQLDELRDLAHDLHGRSEIGADALLAVGRLMDGLDRRRQSERDDFVERFAAYDTKDNRRALDALLAGISPR